jgi:sec-independent protein translocase protein TatC
MRQPEEVAELDQTKMSFGEHLEELRRALFKSVIALVLGFIIGLFFGWHVVAYVQQPLREELTNFYLRQSRAKVLERLEAEQAAGLHQGKDLNALADEVVESRLVEQEFLVRPEDLTAALEGRAPELADQAEEEALTRESMVRLKLYQPMEDDQRTKVVELDLQSPFVIYIKASFVIGAIIASPFVFFFIWEFIAAGLYRTERSYVYTYLPICLGLFFAGAWLAYYKAFGYMLQFLLWFYEKMHLDPTIRLSEFVSLVILLPLGFGVSFQLPLVMLLLERIGVFTIQTYLAKWRISVVVIAVLSMVLTPGGDIGSMMLMFVPLTGLYFLGIAMCKYMPGGPLRSPLRRAAAESPSEQPKPPPTRPEDVAGS